MARVREVHEAEQPELAELIARLRGGRRGRLINIYKLLLNSPSIAEAWFELVGAVRWQTELEGALREIVIIRVAMLNGVDYVLKAHEPYALEEGLTPAQRDAIADWQGSNLFGDEQRAALALTDAMTRDLRVPDQVFADVARHFSDRQIVELTTLIGVYNMHTRVLEALQIDPEPVENA
jgi:AhpD family alkylhydroperoxidase